MKLSLGTLQKIRKMLAVQGRCSLVRSMGRLTRGCVRILGCPGIMSPPRVPGGAIGFVTTGELDGLDATQLNTSGMWKADSSVPGRFYSRNNNKTAGARTVVVKSGSSGGDMVGGDGKCGQWARAGVDGTSSLTVDRMMQMSREKIIAQSIYKEEKEKEKYEQAKRE
jgi:hypothetical protein